MHAEIEKVLYCDGRNRRTAVEEQSCVLFSIAALLLRRRTTLRDLRANLGRSRRAAVEEETAIPLLLRLPQ